MRSSRPVVRAISALVVAGLVALAFEACQSPTQVTLEISYRGPCSDLQGKGIAIVVGDDALASEERIERNFFTAETTECKDAGRIGSLVITPGDRSQRGAVVVLAGLDRRPQDCVAKDGYFGCIIARRTFSFAAHAGLVLPIVLDPDCKNVPCNAVSTCKSGACVSSEVSCEGDRCEQFGTLEDGGPVFVDAPTSSDQLTPPPPIDGGADADASSTTDAPPDAPKPMKDGGIDAPSCPLPKEGVHCPGINDPPCAFGMRCCEPSLNAGFLACTAACGGPPNPFPHIECRAAVNCPGELFCCAPPFNGTQCSAQCAGPPIQTNMGCLEDCDCASNMRCDLTQSHAGITFKCVPK